MDLETYRKSVALPLRQATLLFLMKDDQLLLAMKKRGFGEGKWNGVGGKVEAGEDVVSAMSREALEEIGCSPVDAQEVARLRFYFPEAPRGKVWDQEVIVFIASAWEGAPVETEEMAPRWFPKSTIPYKEMWSDDELWLPHVLNGKVVTADFMFDARKAVVDYQVQTS